MKNAVLLIVLLALATTFATAIPRPHVFIKNDGRWPAKVLYAAPAPNAMMWITSTGLIVEIRAKGADGQSQSTAIRYDVIGSKGSSVVTAQRFSDAPTVSILTAHQSGEALQTASTVVVHNVLPGIHLEYVWDGDNVRYNVHADAAITLPSPLFATSGAQSVSSTQEGVLTTTALGNVSMTGIVSMQTNATETIPTSWRTTTNTFGFSVSQRNLAAALTIDPIVRVFTLHGDADETISVIKRRADGSYVIGGWTTSISYTNPPGTISPTRGAGEDGFVAIVSADLKTVMHWAYISGANNERVRDVAFNSNGQISVVGETNSADFPVKGSIVGQTRGSMKDGFLVVFNSDLTNQVMGSLINGAKDDVANGVAVNTFGQIVIVGTTASSAGLATFESFDDTLRGGTDGFIYVMNPSFLMMDSFTYLGGGRDDAFNKVVIDQENCLVICGTTASEDFYTYPKKIGLPDGGGGKRGGVDMVGGGGGITEEKGTNPYNHIFNGGASDVVVVKFNSSSEILYSTYFGGTGADEAVALFIDTEGAAFVVGNTNSNNLPITNSSTTYGGGYDGFVATITSDGLHLRGASYLGGTSDDFITAVTAYQPEVGLIVGRTESSDFPTFGVGSHEPSASKANGFLARMNVFDIKFSTVLGLEGDATPSSVVLDEKSDAVVAGHLVDFTETDVAVGAGDAFIAKWSFGLLTYRSPLPTDALCAGKPVLVKWVADGIDVSEPNAIDFSIDNGATWTEVGSNIKSREYVYTIPASVPATAQCKFRVRAMRGQEASTPSALNVSAAPNITEQPISAAPCPNASVTLTVVVEGPQCTYQWRKNGTTIDGATAATYVIPAVQSQDNGSYDVVVTNACLTVTSSAASVAITDKPVIDEHPASQTVDAGTTVVLSVVVRGWDLKYKWQKNGADMQGYGADQPTLTLTNVTQNDAGSYACIISSACGSATSYAATIAVNAVSGVDDDATLANAELIVHPQPVSDVVSIRIPQLNAAALLVVRNMQGAEMLHLSVAPNAESQTISIPTIGLPNGTYCINVIGSGSSFRSLLTVLH